MERAAQTQQRALMATKKARLLEVIECLKSSTEATTECRVLLVNMGLLKALPGQVVAPLPGAKKECKEESEEACDKSESAGVICGVPFPEGVREVIPEKVQSIKDFSQVWMCYFLEGMEPQVLSKHAIKALLPQKRSVIPLHQLHEIWEAMTGVDPDTPLQEEQRMLSNVLPEMVQLNEENGRPMSSRTLPVDWALHGWSRVEACTDEHIDVSCIATGRRVLLTHSLLGVPAGKKLNKFYLEKNFSKRRAALIETGGFCKKTVFDLFATADAADKRQVKAEAAAATKLEQVLKQEKMEGLVPPPNNQDSSTGMARPLVPDVLSGAHEHPRPPPPPDVVKKED